MSECTPSAELGNVALRDAESLSPQAIDQILGDLRAWLWDLLAAPPDMFAAESAPPAPGPPDLHTLLGQFLALRQEVNLQTRATRNQQEQNAQTIQALTQSLRALERQQEAARQGSELSQEALLRPLLKALIDIHDALSLARSEVARLQETLWPMLDVLATAAAPAAPSFAPLQPPPDVSVRLPLWARVFGLGKKVNGPMAAFHAWAEQQNRAFADLQARLADERFRQKQESERKQQALERVRQFLEALLTGYDMSLQRLQRTLEQHGLEALACEGDAYDPETMEAVEVIAEPGRDDTEVIQEVRRGYLWRGKVFRFAQVRVARPAAGDRAAGDRAAGDRAAGDRAAGDRAAGDRAAGDRAAEAEDAAEHEGELAEESDEMTG